MRTWIITAAVVLGCPLASRADTPGGQKVVVLRNNTVRVQLAGKQPIASFKTEPSLIRVETADKGSVALVTGLALGQGQLVLTDATGKRETFDVTVESDQLLLKIGSTIKLQMTTKEPIAQAINEKESVARISALAGDPTAVLVTGVAPGVTKITLVGVDGRTETRASGK